MRGAKKSASQINIIPFLSLLCVFMLTIIHLKKKKYKDNKYITGINEINGHSTPPPPIPAYCNEEKSNIRAKIFPQK